MKAEYTIKRSSIIAIGVAGLVLLFFAFLSGVMYEPRPGLPTSKYPASITGISYHDAGCYHVADILSGNLVYFATREAAEAAGKSPCSYCKPHTWVPGP